MVAELYDYKYKKNTIWVFYNSNTSKNACKCVENKEKTMSHNRITKPRGYMDRLSFDLATTGHVDVVVFDLQGRKVATLYSGLLEAKEGHVFTWDASNIASGNYFAIISAPGFTDRIKMTLIK